MSERTVVVDDQAVAPDTGRPLIQYNPPGNWRANEVCVACALNTGPAMSRVFNSSSGGTWTNLWWETERRLISASLDFQGSSVSTYFIAFYRSEDPNSQGQGTLRFFIDNNLDLEKPINEDEYTFELDSSPRLLLFQKAGLDPSQSHNLRITWSHERGRPRVALALDSIEYITTTVPSTTTVPTNSNGNGNGGTRGGGTNNSNNPPANAAEADDSKRIVKIVAPTVVAVVVVFAAILAFFLWRRRRARREKEYLYNTETSEGRRYPHLTSTPFPPPSTYSHPSGLQIEPFTMPPSRHPQPPSNHMGHHSHGSQVVSPSEYTTSSATDYASTYPSGSGSAVVHAPRAPYPPQAPEPPAYTDGPNGPQASAYLNPVRKS